MAEVKTFKNGDEVTHAKFGKGVVVAVDKVELPSDNDPVMLTVKMSDGVRRHFKAGELK